MRIWRKMLYTFWIIVIVISMLTLILIYTYQFEGFDAIWTKYAGFTQEMSVEILKFIFTSKKILKDHFSKKSFSVCFSRQQAIGLHRYKTKKLLFELFYFTFLVVMTAIQVLIFHERYLKQFVWELPDKANDSDESSVRFTMHSESSCSSPEPIKSESVGFLSKIWKFGKRRSGSFRLNFFLNFFIQFLVDLWRFLQKYKKTFEFCCLFVELHYFKVILTLGFAVSLTKVWSNYCFTAWLFTVRCVCDFCSR